MTFNELVLAIPTGLLVLVIAVMILDHYMDKILKKDREERRHDHTIENRKNGT